MVWNSDEEEGGTQINDRYCSQTQPGLQGIICAPSLMCIYCVFHLTRENAVCSLFWESMLWTPYLVNAVDSFSPLKVFWIIDEDEGK